VACNERDRGESLGADISGCSTIGDVMLQQHPSIYFIRVGDRNQEIDVNHRSRVSI
jgi:hypothetical protein